MNLIENNTKRKHTDVDIVANVLKQLHVRNDKDAIKAGKQLYAWRKMIKEGHSELQELYNYLKYQVNQYEKTVKQPEVTGAELLRYLMEEHGHKQSDLADVAPRSVISEILHGKRELNKNHITRLASKYNVSPALFF
jgi:antitoxin component HigA of HigAB toxin-antitoxin module